MSILFYKKPSYVHLEDGPLSPSNCQKYVERAGVLKDSIPEELSFESITEGRTLPPCSLEDFLDYLVYVTHDAENLQFYLWLRDYTKRFNQLPKSEQVLSPEWTIPEAAPDLRPTARNQGLEKKASNMSMDMTAFYDDNTEATEDSRSAKSLPPARKKKHIAETVAAANAQAGLHWQSFSIQPLRSEVTLITAHYLTPSAPRELNLSHRTRAEVLHALQHTTHPSAFRSVQRLVGDTLRAGAHPNFVRWTLCNGNRPRVLFLRTFAAFWLTVALVLSLTLILSHVTRWARVAVAPVLWFGMTTMIASAQGLCVLLHRMHTREIHPWELLPDEAASAHSGADPGATVAFPDGDPEKGLGLSTSPSWSLASAAKPGARLKALGPANAFEAESWVERWRRQGWWRKLTLRQVRVREEALRVIQNKIVIQAELWALLVTVPVVAGVVACPEAGLY